MIIKTCGLRTPANLAELTTLPIDWFGFIHYPKSSRYVGEDVEALRTSLASASGQQQRVGVFVNAGKQEIIAAVEALKLDIVQLHGEEDPPFCRALGDELSTQPGVTPALMKAFRVGSAFDFGQTEAYAPHCAYFLFDTKGKTHGGTGLKFDWSVLAKYKGETPFLLSGGIGPTDVAAVLAFRHPQFIGIDINSKFEAAPAQKDYDLLKAFTTQVSQPSSMP